MLGGHRNESAAQESTLSLRVASPGPLEVGKAASAVQSHAGAVFVGDRLDPR
jgi:hypothetical protein